MGYADNTTFKNSFRGNQHVLPIVGNIENQVYDNRKLLEAWLSITDINIQVGSPITAIINSEQSFETAKITAVSTAIANLTGFLLYSSTQVITEGSSTPTLYEGMTGLLALIGSGVETFLPCDTSFTTQNLNGLVGYDFTNKKLKAVTDVADAIVGVRVTSAPVDGVFITVTAGVASWTQGKVIRVVL